MGQWTIVIHGTGQHHNGGDDKDADRMAKDFIVNLKNSGQTVDSATFTHSARETIV